MLFSLIQVFSDTSFTWDQAPTDKVIELDAMNVLKAYKDILRCNNANTM